MSFCRKPSNGSCGLRFTQSTKCQTHLSKMCDINYIIQRAIAGDASVYRRGSYGDFTNAPEDMQGYLNSVVKGREAYENLPESVKRVYPSADSFLNALNDPNEKERLLKLGVLKAVKPDEPVAVRVIAESDKGTNPEAQSAT